MAPTASTPPPEPKNPFKNPIPPPNSSRRTQDQVRLPFVCFMAISFSVPVAFIYISRKIEYNE